MNDIVRLGEIRELILDLKDKENDYNNEIRDIGKHISGISIKDYLESGKFIEEKNKDIISSLIEKDILKFIAEADKDYYATRLTNKGFSDKFFEDHIMNSKGEYIYLSIPYINDNILDLLYEDKNKVMNDIILKYINKDRVFNMIFKDR